MYNMYCHNFMPPIESRRSVNKKSIPLKMHPMECAVLRTTTHFLFHMKGFRVETPAEVNSFYSLRYLHIDKYDHYQATSIHINLYQSISICINLYQYIYIYTYVSIDIYICVSIYIYI